MLFLGWVLFLSVFAGFLPSGAPDNMGLGGCCRRCIKDKTGGASGVSSDFPGMVDPFFYRVTSGATL